MSEAIVINGDVFFERLSHLYNSWKSDKRASDGIFGGAESIVIVAGKPEQENSYQKHNALHFWLLGYEFPATLMVFTMATMYIVTTGKKGGPFFHELFDEC